MNSKNTIIALRHIEGQIRGIQRMIEGDKDTMDILTQISAIKGALARVEEKILEKQFRHYASEIAEGTSEKKKQHAINETLRLIHQSRKN